MIKPPTSEDELLQRAANLSGSTLGQISENICWINTRLHKGWTGQLLEAALGADAASKPLPDFTQIAVELKTIPVSNNIPKESTFITSIDLLNIAKETWLSSTVYHKLRRVLWIPIEGDPKIPLMQRRVGQAFLWSPSCSQEQILRQDWEELVSIMMLGQLETLSARHGTFLQVRPKAANGKALSWGIDEHGSKIKTLPRGFYLRTSFTRQLF